jgi:HK97 gp10 family phage protein
MSMGIRTTVVNNFGRIAAEMEAGIEAAIVETATAIEQDVKGGGPHAAPIRTGNLRRSIHQDRRGLGNRVAPSVDIGNDPEVAEYAGYVEYGTSRTPAQPFLTPASEAQTDRHAARVAAAVAAGAARASKAGGKARTFVTEIPTAGGDAAAGEQAMAEDAVASAASDLANIVGGLIDLGE